MSSSRSVACEHGLSFGVGYAERLDRLDHAADDVASARRIEWGVGRKQAPVGAVGAHCINGWDIAGTTYGRVVLGLGPIHPAI